MHTSIETFLAELSLLSSYYFPTARLETVYRRSAMVSMRLIITPRLFVDIYFNTSTKRSDFSLILDSARVFGYDNLRTWHYHPFEAPNAHVGCPEPTLNVVFQEIAGIVARINDETLPPR